MSTSSITGYLLGWIWLMSGIGCLTGADVGGDLPAFPVIKSPADLQAWLPGTKWKQVDSNGRFVFEQEFVGRPNAKNKMPWKVIRVDAVEVTASKGKRQDTYQFHETHRWFTNEHRGQVFQLEKQKDELPAHAPNRDQAMEEKESGQSPKTTNLTKESAPVKIGAKPGAPSETALSKKGAAKAETADPLSLPLKIAGGVLALPWAIGLLALLAGLARGSSKVRPNSIESDEVPTGNTLEAHSSNTGRLIVGMVLYGAGYAGLTAMILRRPHVFFEKMGYPFLALLLVIGLYVMFLRFHLILSRNPKSLTKWWGVLGVPCEVRSIRGDQLQRIEITRESHSSGSDSGHRRVSYSYPVRLKHELGAADLDSHGDFETAQKCGERIARFMGLDLHTSNFGASTSRVSGTPDVPLRERIQAGTEKIEIPPRPGDSQIKRNLDGEDVVFEIPSIAGQPPEKIHASSKGLRIEGGGEPLDVTADQIAGLDVKDTHQTYEMWKEEAGVDASSRSNSSIGDFAMKFADKQYAKKRLQVGKDKPSLVVFGDGVDRQFGYQLTPEDAHWLRASLCQILSS
jgi:hypothetical protein